MANGYHIGQHKYRVFLSSQSSIRFFYYYYLYWTALIYRTIFQRCEGHERHRKTRHCSRLKENKETEHLKAIWDSWSDPETGKGHQCDKWTLTEAFRLVNILLQLILWFWSLYCVVT